MIMKTINNTYESCLLGTIMSRYYLKFETVKLFIELINKTTLSDILKIISSMSVRNKLKLGI